MYENQTFDPQRKRAPGDYKIYLLFLTEHDEDQGWEEVFEKEVEELDLDDPVDDAVPEESPYDRLMRLIKSGGYAT